MTRPSTWLVNVIALVCPSRSRGTTTWAPLLSLSSAGTPGSSILRSVSTQGPVALMTALARMVARSPVRRSWASTPTTFPPSETRPVTRA
jgi:hypothetical protein